MEISNVGEIVRFYHDKNNLTIDKHFSGLLMPGMINAHCHLELSHLKDFIPKKAGLVNFVLAINQLRKHFTPTQLHEAIYKGEQEMISNGIVAVGDICNTTDTFIRKKEKNISYHNLIECFGLLEENAIERFSQSLQVYHMACQLSPSSIVPHAPYSLSKALMQLIDDFNRNKISSIHNQECAAENELYEKGTGDFHVLFDKIIPSGIDFPFTQKTSLQSTLPLMRENKHLILVHNTFTSKDDILFAQQQDKEIFWCLCPNANLYIENTLPDVNLLIEENCNIVLGTDSLASNVRLSIWHEVYTLHTHFPSIPLEQKLKWATSNGAKALQLSSHLGSFEEGKTPGILFIENFNLNDGLVENPTIQILYKASV
jgi:cytosine/adenosine deaminase-related metal-dependent hydrolase